MTDTALMGAQLATTRHLAAGNPVLGAKMLAKRAGLYLDPWQGEILTESARMDGDLWSAFENVAIVPRQNGKSFFIVARALAGALLYGEKLILYSAHEFRTAQETWRLMRDVCESDAIAPYVTLIRNRGGGETIDFANGARFKLIARTRSSGRGFSPDCLMFDEAFALNEDITASQLPSLSARPNPQIYYLSSAGTYESQVLLNLRRRGHSGIAPRMNYWEWHAEAADDPRDPRVHAASNPAYGRRITAASVARELESMNLRSFQRERLGVWSESFTETVLSEDDIEKLTIDSPARPVDGRAVGWGVDVSWDRTNASIAAAFHDDDGNAVMVLIETRAGAGWVPYRLGEMSAQYGYEPYAFDARGGITDLMERANRDHDVQLMPLKFSEYPAACADVAQRVADGSVRFGRSAALLSDLAGATARSLPTGWVWDRKGATPPTNLIAATCALHALEHAEGGSSVAIY